LQSRPACTLCGSTESRLRFEKQGRDFLECRGCGLVWIDPLPTPAEVETRYRNAYSQGEYAAFADAWNTRNLISQHRLGVIRDQVQPGRWLDVGCATGSFVAAAIAAGQVAEGLDVSREAVEIARESGLIAHHGRVEDFEPTQLFDTITAFDVLEHAIDPRAFVKRLHGWLGPGGNLVLTLPDVSSIYPMLLMRRHWFFYWPDEHLFYFNPRTIQRLLKEEGFEMKRVTRAYKPLSLAYSARNLEAFNGALGRVAQAVVGVLPAGLREHPFRLYVGEMLVVARRRATGSP
jgi:2-polyprenyl-3-methyl-5-hydroxy-6-metoxy-1,4-benzoquinol methylase